MVRNQWQKNVKWSRMNCLFGYNMEEEFKIYVDRLRGGHEKKIDECLSPDFLDIKEADLSFEKEVILEGTTYLAEQELVFNFSVNTEALLSCAICSAKVPIEIKVKNYYHMEPLENLKSGVFNYKELLRETILLEVPLIAECANGNCPKRKEILKYLKTDSEAVQEDGFHPFADLETQVKTDVKKKNKEKSHGSTT